MGESVSTTLTAARQRVLAAAAAPMAALLAVSVHSDAVANRFVDKLGVDGVDFRVSKLIDTVLKPAAGAGKVEINDLIVAIVALVLLVAVVYFLFGVLRTIGGRRGGVETLGQVVFALIIGIAGLEVLS
jgi:MFS superfamily sulfate permease-like transporter